VTVILVAPGVHPLKRSHAIRFSMMLKCSAAINRDCRRVSLMIGACELSLLTSRITHVYVVTGPPRVVMLLDPRRGTQSAGSVKPQCRTTSCQYM